MVWLIVSQVLSVLGLVVPFIVVLSGGFGMMNDGSGGVLMRSTGELTFYLSLAYPVVLIGSIVASWVLFRLKNWRLANIVTSIPLIHTALIAALFFI